MLGSGPGSARNMDVNVHSLRQRLPQEELQQVRSEDRGARTMLQRCIQMCVLDTVVCWNLCGAVVAV